MIFFYGSTNIFLEHLGGWGGAWSAQDLEHMSITVLFIGGGLVSDDSLWSYLSDIQLLRPNFWVQCGMLIESTQVRELLNQGVINAIPDHLTPEKEHEQRQHPVIAEFSLNPIPALVILLLGIMMSSHQQSTMLSTMIHKQWGNLLMGASFARGLTYVIMYLKPPSSVMPSRPPTEILSSFGLIAGGIVFMASVCEIP